MKKVFSTLFLLMFVIFSNSCFADFLQPLADARPGQTVTNRGYLLSMKHPNIDAPEYGVLVRTDTGWMVVPAVLEVGVEPKPFLGQTATITAFVKKDKDDHRTLLIKKIEE